MSTLLETIARVEAEQNPDVWYEVMDYPNAKTITVLRHTPATTTKAAGWFYGAEGQPTRKAAITAAQKLARDRAKLEPAPGRMGGARPGAGRTRTTYKIDSKSAKRLQELASHHNVEPEAVIQALINREWSNIEETRAEQQLEAKQNQR